MASKEPAPAVAPPASRPPPPDESNLYGSGPALITQEGLATFVNKHRKVLSGNPGRALLRIIRDGEGNFTSFTNADPDRESREREQEKEFGAWRRKCADAKDLTMAAFVTGAQETWAQYDHEEMVMCLVTFGYVNQVQLALKPWVAEPHEHCTCGVRVGSDARHDQEHVETDLVDAAITALGKFLADRHGEDIAQGVVGHTQKVLIHVYGALHSGAEGIDHEDRVAVYLGGAMCCADGRSDVDGIPDASALISAVEKTLNMLAEESEKAQELVTPRVREKIIRTVVRSRCPTPEESMFDGEDYVQAGVWLESLGSDGIVRYGRHYRDSKIPLSTPESPYPLTEEDVFSYVTAERREAYRAAKKSSSLLDHFYDELLHRQDEMARHPNRYISRKAMAKCPPMIKLCLLSRNDAIASAVR